MNEKKIFFAVDISVRFFSAVVVFFFLVLGAAVNSTKQNKAKQKERLLKRRFVDDRHFSGKYIQNTPYVR